MQKMGGNGMRVSLTIKCVILLPMIKSTSLITLSYLKRSWMLISNNTLKLQVLYVQGATNQMNCDNEHLENRDIKVVIETKP